MVTRLQRRKADQWKGKLYDQRVPIGWGVVILGLFVSAYVYIHEHFARAGNYVPATQFVQYQKQIDRNFRDYQRESQIFVIERDLRIMDRQIRELEASRLNRKDRIRLKLLREDREYLRQDLARKEGQT